MWVLLVTNLATLALLGYLISHFRVTQKVYQRIVAEKRIPGIASKFELNRHYLSTRELLATYQNEATTSLLVGDSLVSEVSWQELLNRPDVAGRGIPGDTSEGVLHRIEDYLSNDRIKRMVIWVGTNDTEQGLPIEETATNLRKIVTVIKEARPQVEIALCENLPVASWQEKAEDRNSRSKQINELIAKIAEDQRVRVIRIFGELADEKGYLGRELTRDGIHLNSRGYSKVSSILTAFLEPAI